jgi:glycine C-acetyltransferase
MYGDVAVRLRAELETIRQAGLWKGERVLEGPQGARISVTGREVLNFCANNYLGLAADSTLVDAAQDGLARWGLGLASVRFICGTQAIHTELEAAIARFLGTDEAILYTSCFDANGGLFETLLGEQDAVISDALNHASIIDGIRLCRAKRHRYPHADMAELERALKETQAARTRLIATDGVFSMDGDIAPLREICDLAERYRALVMVDDSHATGFFGPTGRGTPEYCGVRERVDIVTSTLGKALGGASGGFTASRREVVALLRQRSRPYLFSNTLPPALVSASLACLAMLSATTARRDRLEANTRWFRSAMTEAGFAIRPGVHPIVPIMLGDAHLAHRMAADLLDEGIYVVGFSYPVVPEGQARIRVQISAAHEAEHLERAVAAFVKVGRVHGVLGAVSSAEKTALPPLPTPAPSCRRST